VNVNKGEGHLSQCEGRLNLDLPMVEEVQ